VYQIKSGDTFWYPHFLFRAARGKGLENKNAARVSAACRRPVGGNTSILLLRSKMQTSPFRCTKQILRIGNIFWLEKTELKTDILYNYHGGYII
jgi:hypothetical protein